MYRAYGDNVVVADNYLDITWVDRSGAVTAFSVRTSGTWIRINGKWLTVDYHISKGP